MKLTIEHFIFREKFGEEKAFEMIKNAGFDGVDYSFNASNCRAMDFGVGDEKAKEIKGLLDKYGLAANQAHAPFSFRYGEEMSMENEHYNSIVKSIEFSSIIGIQYLVVHAIAVPQEEDFFTYNYTFYKSLQPYAEKYGVKIAVENLVKSKLWTAGKLSWFVKLLDSPVFCACVDVGHSEIVGIPPEKLISEMEKEVMACVHLHDTDGNIDRHWTPYQGIQNWDAILKAMVNYGFEGDMNLEVIHSFDALPNELYFPLLKYVATVGRYLIEKFNNYKKQ